MAVVNKHLALWFMVSLLINVFALAQYVRGRSAPEPQKAPARMPIPSEPASTEGPVSPGPRAEPVAGAVTPSRESRSDHQGTHEIRPGKGPEPINAVFRNTDVLGDIRAYEELERRLRSLPNMGLGRELHQRAVLQAFGGYLGLDDAVTAEFMRSVAATFSEMEIADVAFDRDLEASGGEFREQLEERRQAAYAKARSQLDLFLGTGRGHLVKSSDYWLLGFAVVPWMK